MRRTAAVLILLAVVSGALAIPPFQMVVARKNAAVECTADTDSAIFDFTGDTPVGTANITGATASTIAAQRFVLATDHTITEYILYVIDNNQAQSLTVQIYNDNANTVNLASPVADTAVTLGNASVPDAYGNTTFTLAAAKSLSAGTYWLVQSTISGGSFSIRSHSESGWRLLQANSYFDNFSHTVAVYGCED